MTDSIVTDNVLKVTLLTPLRPRPLIGASPTSVRLTNTTESHATDNNAIYSKGIDSNATDSNATDSNVTNNMEVISLTNYH